MAGLTKAQKAERAATQDTQDAPDTILVSMTKDGESLDVHPSCVASHRAAGWKIEE